MNLICKKCGKEYDDSELKCPYCGETYTEEKQIDDLLEVPPVESLTTETNQTETLSDVKISDVPSVVNAETVSTPNEEPTSVQSVPTQTENIEEIIPVEESHVEEVNENVIDYTQEETMVNNNEMLISEKSEPEVQVEFETETQSEPEISLTEVTPVVDTLSIVEEEPAVKAEISIIETPKLDEILPTDTLSNLDETNISNENLETVSVDNVEEILEEKDEVFEIPEMPAPEVGEVDLTQLIDKYDTDEKINLEKIEAKKQYDDAISEQKRLEAEAKRQQPMPKPDLLATIPDETDVDIDIKPTKKKGKKPMRKVMNAIIVILIVAIIGVLIWYFIQGQETKENTNYMKPIEDYFTGYKENDSTKMLATFVPCVAQTDEITTLITTTVSNSSQYGVITLEYKETNAEVVNKDDQKYLDDYLKTMCPTNTPTIEEYKHLYVEQKIKGQEDKEFTVNHPEFWVVKISNEWYILQLQ